MKKFILTAFTVTSLLVSGTPVFAELFSVSVGIPLSHTITGKTAESDGVSGSFVHAKLPLIPVGLGIESYKTKVKDSTPLKIATMMFDIFYLLPVPIINLTLGIGTGNVNIVGGGSNYEKGSATQWYTSIGIPILPLFDIHISYRSITAKNTKYSGTKLDLSGNVTGLGLTFVF